MSISLDCDSVESAEIFSPLSQTIGDDAWIKAVEVIVHFQTERPGALWGKSIEDKVKPVKMDFDAFATKASDADIIHRKSLYLASIPSENELKLWAKLLDKETQLLSRIEYKEAPALCGLICQGVRAGVRDVNDRSLMSLILRVPALSALVFPTGFSGEKAKPALSFFRQMIQNLSDEKLSQKLQELLPLVKNDVVKLFYELIDQRNALEKTLRLPIDSEEMQAFLAAEHKMLEEKVQSMEMQKVATCYKSAMKAMKEAPGFTNLSQLEITVVFASKSDLHKLSTTRYLQTKDQAGAWTTGS